MRVWKPSLSRKTRPKWTALSYIDLDGGKQTEYARLNQLKPCTPSNLIAAS